MSITKKKRDSLPPEQFGLPEQKKYPLDTLGRARNAPARASQMHAKGLLTAGQEEKIDLRAHRAIARKTGK